MRQHKDKVLHLVAHHYMGKTFTNPLFQNKNQGPTSLLQNTSQGPIPTLQNVNQGPSFQFQRTPSSNQNQPNKSRRIHIVPRRVSNRNINQGPTPSFQNINQGPTMLFQNANQGPTPSF